MATISRETKGDGFAISLFHLLKLHCPDLRGALEEGYVMAQKLPGLTTERLVLRGFERDDATVVQSLLNNWNVASMLARVPYPYTIDMAEDWVARRTDDTDDINVLWEGGDISWAVTTKAGQFIGTVGLHGSAVEVNTIEIGYWFGQPHWGKGYATEAVRAVVAQAFGSWKIPALRATHAKDNPASGYVLAKNGFCYTGEVTVPGLARGADMASKEYRLKREDGSQRAA